MILRNVGSHKNYTGATSQKTEFFVIFFTQTIGLLRRVISPSQVRYLRTEQHTHTE
jgi:hypothetical protein